MDTNRHKRSTCDNVVCLWRIGTLLLFQVRSHIICFKERPATTDHKHGGVNPIPRVRVCFVCAYLAAVPSPSFLCVIGLCLIIRASKIWPIYPETSQNTRIQHTDKLVFKRKKTTPTTTCYIRENLLKLKYIFHETLNYLKFDHFQAAVFWKQKVFFIVWINLLHVMNNFIVYVISCVFILIINIIMHRILLSALYLPEMTR